MQNPHRSERRSASLGRRQALALGLAAPLLAGGAARAEARLLTLEQAIDGDWRSTRFRARDASRHPAQELRFFGLHADMNVIEIWPAGGYWTEILAPYLRGRGTYTLGLGPPGSGEAGAETALLARMRADPALYGDVRLSVAAPGHVLAPPGSADLVMTFRNLHNWMKAGEAEAMIRLFHAALRPGGILGIEEHRGRADAPQDPRALDGYVRQDYATRLITDQGFTLLAGSDINANPRDTTHWPAGVWTLPPTLALGQKDRARYLAVGEADNFVLRFRKR